MTQRSGEGPSKICISGLVAHHMEQRNHCIEAFFGSKFEYVTMAETQTLGDLHRRSGAGGLCLLEHLLGPVDSENRVTLLRKD